jgi:hypothetical protein
MVEPFGTCPPALPNTFPQHSVARLPLRQQIRDSIGANEITCSKAGLPGAHRSPPIRSHRSHTSDGSVRGGRNSRSSSNFSLHSIVCRPGGPYVSLPAEPRGQKLRAMLEVEEGARPREERTTERRPASSPRPEQPTILPTSYTTSWDLTFLEPLLTNHIAAAARRNGF